LNRQEIKGFDKTVFCKILNISVLIVNSSFSSNKKKLNSVEDNQIGGNKHETLQNEAILLDVQPGVHSYPTHRGKCWPLHGFPLSKGKTAYERWLSNPA
jgi:hypothetical protein